MNTKHLLMAALLAGAFSPALAWQAGVDADATALPGAEPRERIIVPGPGHDMTGPFGPGLMQRGKVVKNAPYSAEAITESQRTLADGNQIVTRTSTMSYRDSAGRVRRETRGEQGTVRSIAIIDPSDHTSYVLRPDTKTAVKIGPRRDMARTPGETRAHAEAVREQAGKQIILKRIERDARRDLRENGPHAEQIRIMIDHDQLQRGHLAGLERLGPALAGAFGDMKWSSKATVKDLGSKDIDGIKAQGKLRTYEIPAGEIGNRNPIVVSSESWYSPELQVTLMMRHSDPRTGERSYRLAGIKREEPAPAMFSVPSDYTVKDRLAQMRKFEIRKKEASPE